MANSLARPSRVRERGQISPPPWVRKGGENMEPNRTEWQKRCTFNGFCKTVLRNEAIDAIRERKYRRKHEVTFSELSPQEENQLYTCDQYFANDEAEKSFFVAGREITAKMLADALHSLPEEKRQAVLLYYFFDMSDKEIAELMKIPRSTVQFRRTSSFELLKRFLEEKADDWKD
ncbi:RNA polymerase sigma factor [Gallibacter sp. Marseille-QA0791]|uniref:RNA polymerase sigma factor n=1 Tax=Gallibacter sp. Marseille-QA0791 TaxID=3378781 RepID=UPI003D102874